MGLKETEKNSMKNFASRLRKCKLSIRYLYLLLFVLVLPNDFHAWQTLIMKQNYLYTLHNPLSQFRNGDFVELLGVERWTNAAIMNLKFFWNGKTTGLSVNNEF